jgi:hypothetical protein
VTGISRRRPTPRTPTKLFARIPLVRGDCRGDVHVVGERGELYADEGDLLADVGLLGHQIIAIGGGDRCALGGVVGVGVGDRALDYKRESAWCATELDGDVGVASEFSGDEDKRGLLGFVRECGADAVGSGFEISGFSALVAKARKCLV